MSQKNPPWANWGATFFVDGKQITKFYRTKTVARASIKFQTLVRNREVLWFRIVREEYRIFQDFLTREDNA